MNDQYTMFEPQTSGDTPNAISSQALESGLTPCDLPDGMTTVPPGPEAAPARPSPSQAKAKGLTMLVTSGRYGCPLLASQDLQSSLENRLMERLDTGGSTLYRLTWKQRYTPLRRPYLALQSSERRTEETDCGGWPTAAATDGARAGEITEAMSGTSLTQVSAMASWTTPQAHDTTGRSLKQKEIYGTKHGCACLVREAELASWPSPTKGDGDGGHLKDGTKATVSCAGVSKLASWASPTERDYKFPNAKPYSERGGGAKGEQLANQAAHLASWPALAKHWGIPSETITPMLLAALSIAQAQHWEAFGVMLISSTAEIRVVRAGGQLRPEHSRWLMGLPPAWDACGVTAMPSSRKLRRNS